MSTAYYILKNEAAPEWSSITLDQLKAIAKSNGFKLQRSSSDDGWVLYDGSYLHVGLAQDGTVTSFERFGGNNVQDMLDAIGESLGEDQFIASEHDDVVSTLFEAEFGEDEGEVATGQTEGDVAINHSDEDKRGAARRARRNDDMTLTPTSTPEEVATYIYDNVTIQIFQDTPRQELSTGDDEKDFLGENEQYADKIYDETLHEMVDFAPATEVMTVEEFIEAFWPQQAEEIRGMIYEHIYAGIT
jgi:hypothetical protein